MKNLLLASTALVAFTGAAAAEVTISGLGRFGVVASNGSDTRIERGQNGAEIVEDGANVEFSSRLRVIFDMAFESDTGLTFGGSTRADNAADANDGLAGSVFVSGDFGKLSVGDLDSAAEQAVGNISGVGYTGVGDYNETFYLLSGGGDNFGNDDNNADIIADPSAVYAYSTGGATFYLGIGNPAGKAFSPDDEEPVQLLYLLGVGDRSGEFSQQYSVGVNWANDQFSVGAGYESTKAEFLPESVVDANGVETSYEEGFSQTYGAFYLGGTATFGGATVKAMYGDITDLDYTQYGMSVDYTFDAVTLTAFFRNSDYSDRVVEIDGEDYTLESRTAYGIGAAYDLGGGVEVKGGIVDPDLDSTYYQADLGVTFKF